MARVTIVLSDIPGEGFLGAFHLHTEWEPEKKAGELPTSAQEIGMQVQEALLKCSRAIVA
jgi:hypothetical protein